MLETVSSEQNKMKPHQFPGFLLANVLFCLWIGYLLDYWFGTRPLFMIVLLLYAIIGSMVLLVKKGKKSNGQS